ncbi:MAG: single-strand DNA-binding protein [Flavobacterium sp.]
MQLQKLKSSSIKIKIVLLDIKNNFINHLNLHAMKNRVQLIGHVGQEPEVKNLEGGKKLANISIATNEVYYKDNGDKVEKTEWHRVTAWGKTAEIIEKYVTKGKELAIDGKLTTRSYDDKDGNKRYITEIVANEVLLLGK